LSSCPDHSYHHISLIDSIIYGEIDYITKTSNNYIGNGKYKERRLFRLTTHSLRHYYIDKVYKSCKDPLKTQKLARHQDFKSTQVYIHLKQEDIDKTLKDVFENENISIKEDEMNEFITFFNMWKSMKEKTQ
jgi:integrase